MVNQAPQHLHWQMPLLCTCTSAVIGDALDGALRCTTTRRISAPALPLLPAFGEGYGYRLALSTAVMSWFPPRHGPPARRLCSRLIAID